MLIFLMTGLTGAGSFIRIINEKLILNFWQIMNVAKSLIYATRYEIFVSGHFGKKNAENIRLNVYCRHRRYNLIGGTSSW